MDDVEQLRHRVAELEKLISALRHDINGALTPALLMADYLRNNSDPAVRRAGERIGDSVVRATKLLKASRDVVPPQADKTA